MFHQVEVMAIQIQPRPLSGSFLRPEKKWPKPIPEKKMQAMQRWADTWCRKQGCSCSTLQIQDLDVPMMGRVIVAKGWAVSASYRLTREQIDLSEGRMIIIPVILDNRKPGQCA